MNRNFGRDRIQRDDLFYRGAGCLYPLPQFKTPSMKYTLASDIEQDFK